MLQTPEQKRQDDEFFRYMNTACDIIVVAVELFLIAQSAYCVIVETVPYAPSLQASPVGIAAVQVVFGALAVTAVRSLYYGSAVKSDAVAVFEVRQSRTPAPRISRAARKKARYCDNCGLYKDADVHHCQACNRCVVGLDHHCHFLGNCVGTFNYRFFLSYVFVVHVIAVANLCALSTPLALLVRFEFDAIHGRIWRLIVTALASAVGALFTLLLVLTHVYLLANGITFLEYKLRIRRVKYPLCKMLQGCLLIARTHEFACLKDFTRSWEAVFGTGSTPLAIFYPRAHHAALEALAAHRLAQWPETQARAAREVDAASTDGDGGVLRDVHAHTCEKRSGVAGARDDRGEHAEHAQYEGLGDVCVEMAETDDGVKLAAADSQYAYEQHVQDVEDVF